MTQINVLGKDIKVVFNMATLIAYEQITDKAYNPQDLDRTENRISLLYAAILSADRGCAVEMADLLEKANNDDIRKLDDAVSKEMLEFYKVPKVVADKETYNSTESDLPKNV